MANDNCQKIKLLKLYELLKQETDENHAMTTAQICQRLGDLGISCDRRTLSKDIALLNEYGYEIMDEMQGHEKGYYVIDRAFSVPELKVMMDAVHAANFITEKKSEELIDRIAALGGSHKAELLKRNQTCFNTHRHSNEAIYYNIDACEHALQQQRRLAFYYFDLNERLGRVYRKNKKQYQVDPMALIMNNNNYYLMCYTSKYDGITNYRLDRMEQVEVIDEPVDENAIIHSSDAASFNNQAFSMYGGPVEKAVIQFSDTLIGVIFDKFGESTQMIRQDEHTCIATVDIQKSPTFWGWLFTFGQDMKILAPEPLVKDWKEQIEKLNSL